LVNKNPERVNSIDHTVDTKVKFQIVYQIRFVKVPLSDNLFSLFDINIFKFSCQINSPTLTQIYRLNYESLIRFLLVELIPKVSHLSR
jgi:hypothetical protein